MDIYNTIIIGSGPAGLTAAIYAARASLAPLVLAGQNPGGQLMQTTEVENFPGFINGILGPELMENMTKQAERFGAKILQETAVSVDFSAQPFVVTTNIYNSQKPPLNAREGIGGGMPQGVYLAKTVIIATGAEANWLGLPNEQRLRGKGVSACATCDGFFFKGKDVAVIGGGDSAMEEANFLSRFANTVTIVHRREEFKASKIMLQRAKENPKIKFVTNAEVLDVLGAEKVEGLKIKDKVSGSESDLAVQGMFLAIGHTPAGKIFKDAGVEVNEKGYIVPKYHTETNVPGVFCAGDVDDARYRQAITAAGMGCMAALDVEKYLSET